MVNHQFTEDFGYAIKNKLLIINSQNLILSNLICMV